MTKATKQSDLLLSLEESPADGIEHVYKDLRPLFMNFTRHLSLDRDWQLEAFHKGVLAFYELYTKGDYDPARATIKTLVFKIGKNQLLTRMKREGKAYAQDEWEDLPEIQEEDLRDEVKINKVKRALDTLGEKCKRIMILFYYHHYSILAIKEEMNYLNENTVKAHKSRCLKQLRESVNSES